MTMPDRADEPEVVAHVEPCDGLIDLQAAVAKIPSKGNSVWLALTIVLCVTLTLLVCAYLKILPGEAIAATIGMLAGRLTSNIGGVNGSSSDN